MQNMFKPSKKNNQIKSVEAVLVSLLLILDTSIDTVFLFLTLNVYTFWLSWCPTNIFDQSTNVKRI